MLRDAVMQAATRPEVRAAVLRVYADLQREIDARKPICNASGRCCRFEEFGHRLYVTTIELAAFVADLPGHPTQANPGGCPFQSGGLCSVHTIRPFGCRVFFCDATSDEWQHEQYERFHAELKRLHERFGVPYQYIEWREGLRQSDLLEGLPLAVSRTQEGSIREGSNREGSIREGSIRETASGNPARSGNPGESGNRAKLSLPQLPL